MEVMTVILVRGILEKNKYNTENSLQRLNFLLRHQLYNSTGNIIMV